MTQIGSVYGQSLYELAKSEDLSHEILEQLRALSESFAGEPDFLRLLGTHSLTKQERCAIIDDSFRGKLHIYVLNFLKILTEKGYALHFSDCCAAYEQQYNLDHNILKVTAVTAVALSKEQSEKLTTKLETITGKNIALNNRVDASVMGGVRLDFDGKQMDDTVAHRLESIRKMLSSTVL